MPFTLDIISKVSNMEDPLFIVRAWIIYVTYSYYVHYYIEVDYSDNVLECSLKVQRSREMYYAKILNSSVS